MAGAPRKFKITYGTYTVGAIGQDALLDGYHTLDKTVDKDGRGLMVVSFAAIITASSDAAFLTKVAALEAAFSTPRQLLKIENSATTLLSLDPTSGTNTGFNAAPSFRKDEHVVNTARTRRYLVTVAVELPSQISGNNGRRAASVEISHGPQDRLLVTFKGEYTAAGSNTARAQYNAQAPTYFAAFLLGLTGTFEKVSEVTNEDDANKTLTYTTIYQEILSDQSSGGRDDSSIVDHTIRVASSLDSPGDWGSETRRLTDVVVQYTAFVVKTTTTLTAVWESLKEYVISYAEGLVGGEAVALESEQVDTDPSVNRISATIRLKCAVDTSNLLEATVQQALSDRGGKAITPVHDGTPFGAYVHDGPGTRFRTTRKVFLVKGGAPLDKFIGAGEGSTFGVSFGNGGVGTDNGGGGGGGPAGPPGVVTGIEPSGGGGGATTGWITVGGDSSVAPATLGRNGRTIQVTRYESARIEQYVTAPQRGGGGGGGLFIGLTPGPGGSYGGVGIRGA